MNLAHLYCMRNLREHGMIHLPTDDEANLLRYEPSGWYS